MIAQLDKIFLKMSLRQSFKRLFVYFLYEGRPLTTKGRWLNCIVFMFLRLQSFLPVIRMLEKPVFIIGTGRSGTTILGVALGMHKDVVFLNEPKAVWAYAYSGEDIIGSYHKRRGVYRLNGDQVNNSVIKKMTRIYSHLSNLTMSKCIVDKYPELIFRTEFVKKIFPNSMFIFLYRNGWDTCHSIDKWSKRKGFSVGIDTENWWGLNNRKWIVMCDELVSTDPALKNHYPKIREYTNHAHMAAVEWILTMKQGLRLLEKNVDVLALKYEDFVLSKVVREDLLKFCGLDVDVNFSDYCESVLNKPSPNPVINLPDEIATEFERIMKKLGYE